MMFTLVALQNMILNFHVGMQENQSWTVQLKWQQANMSGTTEETIDEVLQSLDDAEEEDVNEETDECWCRPRVLKIKKRKKASECDEDEYHDVGQDFLLLDCAVSLQVPLAGIIGQDLVRRKSSDSLSSD